MKKAALFVGIGLIVIDAVVIVGAALDVGRRFNVAVREVKHLFDQ